jgi:hypothetical protein
MNFFYPTIVHGWSKNSSVDVSVGQYCKVDAHRSGGAAQATCGKYGNIAGCARMCDQLSWCNSFAVMRLHWYCCLTAATALTCASSEAAAGHTADITFISAFYTSSTVDGSPTDRNDAIISFDGGALEPKLEDVWRSLDVLDPLDSSFDPLDAPLDPDGQRKTDYLGRIVRHIVNTGALGFFDRDVTLGTISTRLLHTTFSLNEDYIVGLEPSFLTQGVAAIASDLEGVDFKVYYNRYSTAYTIPTILTLQYTNGEHVLQ